MTYQDPAEPVRIDVDGDGVPDLVSNPAREVAVREQDDVAIPPPAAGGTVQASVTVRTSDLRPVVPGWMRTAEGRRNAVRWWVLVTWHRLRFHAFRAPAYAGRVLLRAPVGLWRTVAFLARWALDTRADALEQQLATGSKADAEEFRKLREDRAGRVRARLTVLAVGLVLALAAGVLVDRFAPSGVQALVLVVLVGVLARIGSDATHPLIGQVMASSTRYRELTDAIVMRALRAAGLGGQAPKVDKDGRETSEDTRATLAQPIARSANGAGYELLIDLPFGKTAGDAAEAVEKLASGLDVDIAQVFPEPVTGSARRVRMYIADTDPMLLPPHRSPLARLPKVSVWDAHPVGRTPVGREVRTSLLFNSFLLGAVPRAGKSFAAKCLVTPAVLDPHCDLSVFDCGGGRDWLPAGQVALDYVAGDEEEELAVIVAVLDRIRGEARERLASFRTMTGAELPEDKLTRELAASGLHPHLVVVDEIQNLLRAQSKEIRAAALELMIWVTKTAPKAGYIPVLITQRPAADVIPSDLRDVTTVRLALRTKSAQGSDAILGSYVSAQGYRTDRFREDHKGAAVLGGVPTGAGGDLQVIRTDLLKPAEFEQACSIGRQRRLDAGTLRGAAAGQAAPVQITVTVVEDVLNVWPNSEPKVQAVQLVERLQEHFPQRHAGLDQTSLTRALKDHGVPVVQVFRDNQNRNGYELAAVRRAARALEAGAES